MVLAVFRIAILVASCVVPSDRAGWRRAWNDQIRHYRAMLRARGVKGRYVRIRTWHHFVGAMRDAGRLFFEAPLGSNLRAAISSPFFCLGAMAAGLAAIAIDSHGLAITRAMLFPPYPDPSRLVLISEGGNLQTERHPIPPALLDYWRAHNQTFSGLAGYRWDRRGEAAVTAGFFEVLGTRPKTFLLRRIRQWLPAAGNQNLGVVGRLKPGVSAEDARQDLRRLAVRFWDAQGPSPYEPVQVISLVTRTRQPFYAYALLCL